MVCLATGRRGDGEEEGLTSILRKAQGAHNLLSKGNNLIIQSQAVLRSEDQTVAVCGRTAKLCALV